MIVEKNERFFTLILSSVNYRFALVAVMCLNKISFAFIRPVVCTEGRFVICFLQLGQLLICNKKTSTTVQWCYLFLETKHVTVNMLYMTTLISCYRKRNVSTRTPIKIPLRTGHAGQEQQAQRSVEHRLEQVNRDVGQVCFVDEWPTAIDDAVNEPVRPVCRRRSHINERTHSRTSTDRSDTM